MWLLDIFVDRWVVLYITVKRATWNYPEQDHHLTSNHHTVLLFVYIISLICNIGYNGRGKHVILCHCDRILQNINCSSVSVSAGTSHTIKT